MPTLLMDLDDTLVPDVVARDLALAGALEQGASNLSLAAASGVVRDTWRGCQVRQFPSMAGVSSWEALWTDFSQCGLDADQVALADEFKSRVWHRLVPKSVAEDAAADYLRTREALVTPYPWVDQWLTDPAQVQTLWCVTNGSSYLQHRKLVLSGLDVVFARVVVSGEIGDVKASSRFVHYVADELSSIGERALGVVGDSDDSDGHLAAALGVPFCKITPGEAYSGSTRTS